MNDGDSSAPPQRVETPVVTYSLLLANLLIWAVTSYLVGRGQLLHTLADGPGVRGLIAVGANNSDLVFQYGEGWRLISASFLHVGFLHLVFNSLALWIYGPILEREFGKGSFLLLYLVSGIGGYLLSSRMSPEAVSAGASASVFGLIGALWSMLKRRNAPDAAKQTVIWIIGLNFIWGLQPGSNIDNWAHGGGLLTGLALGFALESLPRTKVLRVSLNVTASLVSLALLAYGLGNAMAFARYVLFSQNG
ncbi:MAG: rhomboid family intramembrane serine protease [Armatimonadetes bacterium]|nr:rhomboid family intramembrane serine protease [Armatimonadota bacterium]